MKQYILYVFCLLMCFFIACNDDAKNTFPTGILYLNVEEDATMLTKAENAVTYESLQVAILQGEEDAQDTVKVFNDYLKDVKSQRLILPIGKYTIAVRSNGIEGAGWETPLYMGQEEVEVKQGEITNTKVVCTIANTKVSVIYEDALKDYFTDYQTTVSNPSGTLLYTRDEYRSGFFTPEKLTVQLKLVNKDGNEFVMKKVYPEIEPQYHYRFIYAISNDDTSDQGGFNVDIDVDKNLQEITYNIFIKKEELTYAGEPSFDIEGFTDGVYDHNVVDNAPEKGKIQLKYKLGKNNKLQSFKVTTDSPTLIAAGLNSFDLMKDDDVANASKYGFEALPKEPSETSSLYVTYSLDLSGIVTYLEAINEKPTLHTFTVDLLDDKFQETSVVFAIKIKPDVDALVDDPVCWSTFVVLKGVCIDNTSYFKIQKGNDESSIKNIKTIRRGQDGEMVALVTGLEPNNTYKYWIASEENIDLKCTPSDIIMDESSEVPNLKFDEWCTLTGKAPIVGNKQYPSPNLNGNDVYWESGNLGAAAAGAVLTQSTTIVATKSSQFAAKLSSLRAEKIGMGAFAAGSIYSGYPKSVDTDGAELKYGRQYSGFPTHLRGYYRYEPGVIDNEYNAEISGRSDKDQCFIYIALSIKDYDLQSKCPVKQSGINKINVIPFDKNDPNIFAYGEYVSQKTENLTGKEDPNIIEGSGYAPFDITLKYRKGKMPTEKDQVYIILVATSSKAGDYFTGSTSSVLYVDEFSLDYDYDAASFADTEFKGLNPINIKDLNSININDK